MDNSQKTKIRFGSDAINKLKDGDIGIFEKLFRQYCKKLIQFSYFIVSDEQTAEDIVQDVFYYLWEHRLSLKSSANIESYLYSAVRNKSLNHKRHQKVKKTYQKRMEYYIEELVEMPDDLLQYKDLELAIKKAIDSLPKKRRIIFYLHRFEEFTYKEIATIQGISVKTVETQIRLSLQHLEKQLSKFLVIFF